LLFQIKRPVADVLILLENQKNTTVSPSNGMDERFNKTIEQHLSKVVDQHQKDFLIFYRAAVHNSTLSKVLFGRELRLPCDVVFGSPTG